MVLLKCDKYLFFECNGGGSTFHYGSIKILKYEDYKDILTTSTFHYGSIKIMIITNRGFGKT